MYRVGVGREVEKPFFPITVGDWPNILSDYSMISVLKIKKGGGGSVL